MLCVPDAEYISPDYPQLWYRGLPRVLTPDEIVTLMADSTKIKSLRRDLLRRATPGRHGGLVVDRRARITSSVRVSLGTAALCVSSICQAANV